MIYVGIDVAKDKHDCFITNSEGEVLFKAFTITNNLDGFNDLYQGDILKDCNCSVLWLLVLLLLLLHLP